MERFVRRYTLLTLIYDPKMNAVYWFSNFPSAVAVCMYCMYDTIVSYATASSLQG